MFENDLPEPLLSFACEFPVLVEATLASLDRCWRRRGLTE